MAPPVLQQKVIEVKATAASEQAINTVLTAQALLGWRIIGVTAYPLSSNVNPGGVFLFFIKDTP